MRGVDRLYRLRIEPGEEQNAEYFRRGGQGGRGRVARRAIKVNFTERRFLIGCINMALVTMRMVPEMKRCLPIFMSAVSAVRSPSGLKRYCKQQKHEEEFFHFFMLSQCITVLRYR